MGRGIDLGLKPSSQHGVSSEAPPLFGILRLCKRDGHLRLGEAVENILVRNMKDVDCERKSLM